jgi:hypothetical protein
MDEKNNNNDNNENEDQEKEDESIVFICSKEYFQLCSLLPVHKQRVCSVNCLVACGDFRFEGNCYICIVGCLWVVE